MGPCTASPRTPRTAESRLSRSVAVVVEDAQGRILLLLRGPTDPWMPLRWNLPGGRIEHGESVSEAGMREAREEAGLRVYALSQLMQVSSPGGKIDALYADFWDGRVQLLDGENSRSAWVPKAVAWTWDLIPPHRRILRRLAAI
jgi:ADP-ribose pyrophosphatase YjhB (NUDIX family)